MQVEFNSTVCRNNAYEISLIEKRIKTQIGKLTEIYSSYKLSQNPSDTALAVKMKREIDALDNQLRSISIIRKSLEKITMLYETNEKEISELAEFNGFVWKLFPVPLRRYEHFIANLKSDIKFELS